MITPKRRAFTLIELTVVIAIMGLLIALLLPAVQSAREAARRTECRNKLKQLGLALHNYHEAHRALPPGAWMADGGVGVVGGWGWGAMILPYIDQSPLYQRLDFSQSTCDTSNLAAISMPLSVFACPSDPAPSNCLIEMPSGSMARFACGNYCGVHEMLTGNVSVSFSLVGDGLSNTFMLGEHVYVAPDPGESNFWTSSWCGFLIDSGGLVGNSVPFLGTSRRHLINQPFNSPGVFSSRHAGGAHFTLGDGSVRFVSENLDGGVYEAMGTIAGGEATVE